MDIRRIFAVLFFCLLLGPTVADDTGHGNDGPSAAPTNPDDGSGEVESSSWWDAALENFDFDA